MTARPEASDSSPTWAPWAVLALLVLPFHPLWVDFEQVRRGLLLVVTGALLCGLPGLRRVRADAFGAAFVGALVLGAAAHGLDQLVVDLPDEQGSFQPWEAAYRAAHWFALLTVLRLGAWTQAASLAAPVATLLLVTSAIGLLQRGGVFEIAGYGVEREPVSTLGNLNVASEWTAVAAAATAALLPRTRGRQRWLALAALTAAGVYLAVNPSRSGKVAAVAAVGLLALLGRRQPGRWRCTAAAALALAAGGAAGAMVGAANPALPAHTSAHDPSLDRSAVTLQVRFEIADGVGELLAEAPLWGHGPGQFQVQYPRKRSQAEIEASSFGRRFPTEVRNAHNDWLELLVDGGAPALLLFALLLFRLQRGREDKELLLPLVALLLMMLVRAPALNAPAAALAFWLAGARHPAAPQAKPRGPRGLLDVALGVTLIALGLLPIAGNTAATDYLTARREGAAPPLTAVDRAAWWMPYEPRWHELRAREAMNAGDLQQAAHCAALALARRPFAPPLLLLLGEVLARGGRYGEAIQVARRGLALDPANPELRALVSVALAELGDVERAIREVVEAPHPVLRAGLSQHFLDLATRAGQRAEPAQANRYLIEHLILEILDRSGSGERDDSALVGELQRRLSRELQRYERTATDLRWMLTGALAALDLGRGDLADGYAAAAAEKRARFEAWQLDLLGPQRARLQQRPGWQELLAR